MNRCPFPMGISYSAVKDNVMRNILGVQRLVAALLVRRNESRGTENASELLVGAAAQELAPSERTQEHEAARHALLGFHLQGIICRVTGILVGRGHDAAELRKRQKRLRHRWRALAIG